jgi:phospho-N-acetylmuramoyl-pentapeptide-transferase
LTGWLFAGSGRYSAFAIALVVSAIFAWPIYRLLLRLKSRQTVSQYLGESHQAKQGTPTMGGLILLPGVLVAEFWVDFRGIAGGFWVRPMALFLGFAAIGFLDDFVVPRLAPGKRGLGWGVKLVLELAVASACLASGAGDIWTFLVMVFVVLFFANAYNFADGLDGLAGGLLLLIAPALVLMPVFSQAAAVPCAAMCGAIMPFLFLNSPPAKLFMGDVGSLPVGATLGFVFGSLFIQSARGMGSGLWAFVGLVVLSLVLVAELVPVPLQILSVKLRKGKRLFPRTPIHHTFEHWGWPESRITWMFLLAQAICSGLALCIAALGEWY